MDTPVNAAVPEPLKIMDAIDYTQGFLSCGTVVEIDQRFVVNLALKNREIIPYGINIVFHHPEII
jgi:hypothetical protein